MRQALKLLDESSELTAIAVEGVGIGSGANRSWDGVDCSLLFGSESVKEALRVEVQQLKYSSARPNKNWTVAQMCVGRNGKPENSLLARMGRAFKDLLEEREGKPLDSIKVSLVTNRPISTKLVNLFVQARAGVPAKCGQPWKKGESDLHRLVHSSGLTPDEFAQFAQVMNFQGEVGSRFTIEDEILSAIAEWSDSELKGIATDLRAYVRDRMMPREAADDVITRQKVMMQFGVSDARAIFPCPTAIEPIQDPVSRRAAKTVVEAMSLGAQKICLHGAARVGKTTVLQEIAAMLPSGSEVVTFDCYGAGRYLDASQFRHRPKDAFLQLSNDLARQLRVPLLLAPNALHDPARAFRKRLDSAAETLDRVHPDALLVIAIDAADNSITAAMSQVPAEASFVTELMSFADLRSNIRLVISARTGRLEDLKLPSDFEQIKCPEFTLDETSRNVARYWQARQSWIEDFHHLSGGVPRVQAYAFQHAGDDCSNALEILRSTGEQLEEIFAMQFEEALKKAGQIDLIEHVCAGLAALPRPIPLGELAHVLGLSVSRVADVCTDLTPGVRIEANLISFADEDFEAFVREKGRSAEVEVLRAASDRLMANADCDEYAALNVAPVLFLADRKHDLLEFVEQEPKPKKSAVSDPVRSREIHDKRLLTAIRVCQEAGNAARALRFVLMGVEAAVSHKAVRKLLESFPSLAVRFAKELSRRLILGDPGRKKYQGNLIFCSIGEDAIVRNAVGVRERRKQLSAWLEAREDDLRRRNETKSHSEAWPLNPEAIAADILATALLNGIEQAISHFKQVRPVGFSIAVARALVHRMLGESRHELVQELALKSPPLKALFLLVSLARAGCEIDLQKLAEGLERAKRRLTLRVADRSKRTQNTLLNPYFLDSVLSATEILFARGAHLSLCNDVLSKFLDSELRRIDRLRGSDISLLDAFLRCYCLKQEIEGIEVDPSEVLLPLPAKPQETKHRSSNARRESDRDTEIADLISGVIPVYEVRAKIFSASCRGESRKADIKSIIKAVELNEWRLERHLYASEMRARAAVVLTDLIAIGANPSDVMASAFQLRRGLWPQGDSGIGELCKRLAATPKLHEELLNVILAEAKRAKSERAGAHDRSNRLAAFAELLLPISPVDAKSVFSSAVEVAGELEMERMDQIRFLDRLVGHASGAISEDRRELASKVADIVRDGYIRLDVPDHFPWDEAMSSIAGLDFSTALASAARWHDLGIVSLGEALPTVLTVGLETNCISSAQAAALLCLDDGTPGELLQCVMKKAAREGKSMASVLAEEFAHDILVDRLPAYDELRSHISNHGRGKWARRYVEQIEFLGNLTDDGAAANGTTTKSAGMGNKELVAVDWNPASLVKADELFNEARNVVERVNKPGHYFSLGDVLRSAGSKVLPGDRSKHLDALADILARNRRSELIGVILDAAETWYGQPAVEEWCKSTLPHLIVEQIREFALGYSWEDGQLPRALRLSGLSREQAADCLLTGVARNAENLVPGTIFCVARQIAAKLRVEDAADLCRWYLDRLLKPIPISDRESIGNEVIPDSATKAVGRFLYAYMSDVDLRLRWRAAHGLRRLSRFGESKSVAHTVAQYDQMDELAFRAGNEPFYWIAARLWLVIALDRMSEESPEVVVPHADTLMAICSNDDFPHVLIRDYAADACRKLAASGHLTLSDAGASLLQRVNNGTPVAHGASGQNSPSSKPWFADTSDLRFPFDTVDTVPYWYGRWLRVYQDLKQRDFLNIAEKWILGWWAVTHESRTRLHDSRRHRFRYDNYGLSRNFQGAIPTLELYSNHLEWHAMWCVAGELMGTHRLKKENSTDYDSLTYRVSQGKLTHPPHWLSDFVGPTPLQPHRWRPIDKPMDEWLCHIDDSDFEREIFPVDRPGWVIVDAYMELISDERRETIDVSTGLVSPDTAHALVRALQVSTTEMQFYVCPEGHDTEINTPGYRLQGWLAHIESDARYDDKDPYRNGVAPLQGVPGQIVTKALGLERRYCDGQLHWFRKGARRPSFVYEAWGKREPVRRQQQYYDDTGDYSGRRLLARKEDLAEFLGMQGCELIMDIGVTRNERRPSKRHFGTEDARRTVFDRILLLKRDGCVEAAERSLEAWLPNRS